VTTILTEGDNGIPIVERGSGFSGTIYLSLAKIADWVKMEIVGGQSIRM
jgi:hypothetical protein